MRVLGIETSSARGTVALLEGDRVIAVGEHRQPQAHAERILPLIERALATAGWPRSSLDRIGVGIGPGSFVGLRVGIALAEGLSLGLARPVVGVGSLESMLAALPTEERGPRVALLDARRDELFVLGRTASGEEIVPVCAVPRGELGQRLADLAAECVIVGAVTAELELPFRAVRGDELDLPHARWTAELARHLDPSEAPAVPRYVRGAGATLPNLPPSPLRTPPG